LHDPISYYTQSPASGFWIFEFGKNFVGLIALDANDAKDTRRAFIRHFFVHEAYRKTGIQADILDHALKHAFNNSPTLESVVAVDTPALVPYIHKCLKEAKFQPLTDHRSIGIMGLWKYHTVCLQKKDFQE
jgi:GNAT superfamily N-acetyltransferase